MVSKEATLYRPSVTAGLSMISSRTTIPLAKVTMRESPSSLQSTTNPGTKRFMDSDHIADGVPNNLFISLDFNFFGDSAHRISFKSQLNREVFSKNIKESLNKLVTFMV